MKDNQTGFSRLSFAKTFVLPGLCVFLIPVFALLFFLHAQYRFDGQCREVVIAQIRADANLAPEERDRAIAFFTEHPFSELMHNKEFAEDVTSEAAFHYLTFRWMIRLSALSLLVGFLVFLLAGICVGLSMRSNRAQYYSLSAGWHVLRAFCAMQVVIQGILLVALSYFVTALWFNIYVPKLILLAALGALVAVASLTVAIFKRPKTDQVVSGKVIEKGADRPLWNELENICLKVGTAPPDQVIAGIDDNFYVTEMPVTVGNKTYRGRTLYVSLSLLKQMNGAEADAVLAHEMAHFSGQDTVYSKKISPLLVRYGLYLDALASGAAKPVYYFMNCFRALYELSLTKVNRQREFRADRIASEVTSPHDFATGLLRIVAYSHFRRNVQGDMFERDEVLQTANISEQIESGFQTFAADFTESPEIGALSSSHPFDTHPPISQRLDAVGLPLDPRRFQSLLNRPGDGRWYHKIAGAEQMEREEWDNFEQQFRNQHEESLPYRFLPETEEEQVVVVKAFPEIEIEGNKGSVVINFEALHHSSWTYPVMFKEITQLVLDKSEWLQIKYERGGQHSVSIKMKDFKNRKKEALDTIGRYYGRYAAATAYRQQKAAEAASKGGAALGMGAEEGGSAEPSSDS